MSKRNTKTEVVQVQNNDELMNIPTTSGKIRYLASQNMSRSDIVKKMTEVLGRPIKYQHVRNVLVTELKKAD